MAGELDRAHVSWTRLSVRLYVVAQPSGEPAADAAAEQDHDDSRCALGRTGLLDLQLLCDAEFLHAFAQGGPCDAQQHCGLHLVSARFLQRLDYHLPFEKRNELQLGIAARHLEKRLRDGVHVIGSRWRWPGH